MSSNSEITKDIKKYFNQLDLSPRERLDLYQPLKEFLSYLKMRSLKPTLDNLNTFIEQKVYRKHWIKQLMKYVEYFINHT